MLKLRRHHDIPITGYPDLSGREEHMPLTESNATFPPASRPARDVHTSTGTDLSPGLIFLSDRGGRVPAWKVVSATAATCLRPGSKGLSVYPRVAAKVPG